MAGTEGAFSPMVYESAWAEFVEKYIPGELNNAFILLSYPTDISSNWLYATMFSQFNDSSFIPPRYLYTMNNLAIWYWQFGGRSFLVATVIGLLIGGTYGAAKRSQFVLGWSSIFYLVFLPAIYTMIRVNAFFLHYFVVPIIFLTGARILWLVLRSFPARKRAVTRKWENTGPAELQDHPG